MIRIGLAILFLSGLTFLQPPAWESKINSALLEASKNQEMVDFLIQLKDKADISRAQTIKGKEEKGRFVFQKLRKHAENKQFEILTILESLNVHYQSFAIVNIIKVRADHDILKMMAQRDDVAYIYNDFVIEFDLPDTDHTVSPREATPEWGLLNIKADSVWEMGYKGAGIIVAGQDTGYEWHHPALSDQYRGNYGDTVIHDYNWHDAIHEDINGTEENPCGYDSPYPCDDHGHGTHTMGTMTGYTEENVIGVAPEAKWIACRNMDEGAGIPSTYIECFEWFLAPTDSQGENPDPSKAPHVINNSWSCPENEGCNMDNFAFIEEAIANLKAAGVFISVSAGNSGSQGCGSVANPPAFFENSFAIGSYRKNDTISGFSSRGPAYVDSLPIMKPNISAPGSGIRSSKRDSTYGSSSGTSMASPHVAGAVALVLSAVPQFEGEVAYLEQLFQETARPATTDQDCEGISGQEVPNYTYGYGRLNVLAAVKKALQDAAVSNHNISFATQFEIGPNPFQSFIRMQNYSLDKVAFKLYNVGGHCVYQGLLEESQVKNVDTQDLMSGVYILKISAGGKTISKKLIKI